MKIKVAKLTGPRRMEIFEEELRPLQAGEILIRVVLNGVCHSEMARFEGTRGDTKREEVNGEFIMKQLPTPTYPILLGHEPTGIVEDVGPGVKGLKTGDRVTGQIPRSFASHIIARAESAARLSDSADLRNALIEPLMCTSNIVRAAAPQFGDCVVVVGAGFMGLLALAAMRGMPLRQLVAVDVLDSRLALARELGATATVNAKSPDAVDQGLALTEWRGADVVLEMTGRAAGLDLGLKLVRSGRGKVVVGSYYLNAEPYDFGFELMIKSPEIHVAHMRYSQNPMQDLKRAIWGYEAGLFPMERLITHRFRFEDVQKGYELARSGAEEYIKGAVEF